MAFILEERLTLDSILFRFDLGGIILFWWLFWEKKQFL